MITTGCGPLPGGGHFAEVDHPMAVRTDIGLTREIVGHIGHEPRPVPSEVAGEREPMKPLAGGVR